MHGEFYIAMFQVPNHEDAEKIVRDADPHITAAAEAIKDNRAFPKTKNNMVYRLMSSAVNPVFYPLFVSAKKFTADSRCTGCGTVKRYVAPILGICGSVFMVIAAFYAHGFQPYQAAAQAGGFACPIVFYLIVFAVVIVIGLRFYNRKNK